MSLEIQSALEREEENGRIFRQSKKIYKIKNLTDEEATLVEPASCAIHGLDKLNPPVGVEALIFGAGPTGESYHHTTLVS